MKGVLRALRSWRHRADVLLAAHDAQVHAERYTTLARQHRTAGNTLLAIDLQRIANAYRDSASQYKRDAKRLLREWRATSRALPAGDRRATVVAERARPMPPGRKLDNTRGIARTLSAAPPARRPSAVRMIFRNYIRRKYAFTRIFG